MMAKRKHRPLDDDDAIVRELRNELRRERERHRRVTAAFLALRDVKAQRRDAEPILLGVLNLIQATQETIAAVESEIALTRDEDAKAKAIEVVRAYGDQLSRIKRYAYKRIESLDQTPGTPALMRFLAADQDLKPGDLEQRS